MGLIKSGKWALAILGLTPHVYWKNYYNTTTTYNNNNNIYIDFVRFCL